MTQPEAPAPKPPIESPRHEDRETEGPGLRTVIRTIGWELDHPETWMIPPGDAAALRRSRPGDIGGPAFWKIAVRHLEPAGLLPGPDAPWRDDLECRWTTIVGGMAEMAKLHTGGLSLGRALAHGSVSEHRVLRLLQAHGDALLALVRPVAHQLKSRAVRLDWTDFADLVLSDGREWENRIRRRIALDFYRNLSR